ncbi:hypothetical protein QTP70_024969, partial [Hemibagrus guttatus]
EKMPFHHVTAGLLYKGNYLSRSLSEQSDSDQLASISAEELDGDEEVMGKFGVKERNLEGQIVVDFAKRMDMAVVNTYFQKREEHRVTYKSGGRRTQVDYILCRRGNLKEINDCKVVVGESVARQHRMVVCRMTLMVCKKKRSKIEKKSKWWKLKKEECCEEFRQKLRQALGGQVLLPDDWETTAEVIRETGRKVLGVSSGRRKEDKETWWWNEEVQDSIQRKRLAKKKWDMDRTEENRQEYKELQRRVKREVSKAKQKAYDELYTRLDTREGQKDLYRLARQRDRDGKDVQQKVDKIRKDEVRKALKRMKSGKAVGPDDIPVEYRDGQRELHCVFVDLEKAYDRVPREELWYCMRKSGVAEKYVRVVQDMYERSRTVVRCAVGQTEEFKVEVGLHQGLALSPFLFAIVMDQLSEEVRQESPWTMMFADDIVICSESREQVEENLKRWRFALERRGMKVSRSKTEYMCVTEREGSGTVRLQGEEVKKVQEFKYLGSTVQSNGECGKEVYRTVVRPAMLYGLETVSLRKRQESELEVAELKMLRFSLGVTRLDRIRNDYIRGTAHVGRLGDKVKEARLRWFGHVQRREKIREAFRVLDRDGNGFISKQELGMAMRSLGYMPSEVELAIIMQRLDMDGDGQVDFDEFMTILGPKLLSSETRDGFLGNTIDSIFWQDLSLNFNLHMRIFTIKTSVFHNNILQQELFSLSLCCYSNDNHVRRVLLNAEAGSCRKVGKNLPKLVWVYSGFSPHIPKHGMLNDSKGLILLAFNYAYHFDMQRITLEELKHILFHAFQDHLTMKDIENIIINEEESLNENSGNCHTEFEGVHPTKKNRQTCVRKSLICAFAMAFIISVMLIAANQMLRNGME